MKISKEFILKNIITICCIASFLFLLLPFSKVEAEVSMLGVSSNASTDVSGFDTVFGESSVIIAWLMIVCPAILILMNYIKQLDKYKSILAIVLPIVSVIAAIVTVSTAGVNVEGGNEMANAEIKTVPQVGFVLLLLSYVGTLIAGAMTFYGLKLSKEGIAEFGNKLKTEGFSKRDSDINVESGSLHASTTNTGSSKFTKKTNVSQASDVLSLIKQLSDMKDSGVLTEEEFADKKKELLSQI